MSVHSSVISNAVLSVICELLMLVEFVELISTYFVLKAVRE